MRPSRIRVLVVEDDSSLLECLKMEIDRSHGLKCVGGYLSFERAEESISNKEADVMLLDLDLPGMDGIEATKLIRRKWPRLKVVIFTGNSAEETIYAAFNAGANGFLLKTAPRAELAAALERAYVGGSPISPEVENALVGWFQRRQSLAPHLSPTERTILDNLDRGVSQKEIASQLGMSYHTLRTHINSILAKTGVSSVLRAAYLHRQAVG